MGGSGPSSGNQIFILRFISLSKQPAEIDAIKYTYFIQQNQRIQRKTKNIVILPRVKQYD